LIIVAGVSDSSIDRIVIAHACGVCIGALSSKLARTVSTSGEIITGVIEIITEVEDAKMDGF
jgi:hypothetical protein